jgi:hypothetical protein
MAIAKLVCYEFPALLIWCFLEIKTAGRAKLWQLDLF